MLGRFRFDGSISEYAGGAEEDRGAGGGPGGQRERRTGIGQRDVAEDQSRNGGPAVGRVREPEATSLRAFRSPGAGVAG